MIGPINIEAKRKFNANSSNTGWTLLRTDAGLWHLPGKDFSAQSPSTAGWLAASVVNDADGYDDDDATALTRKLGVVTAGRSDVAGKRQQH